MALKSSLDFQLRRSPFAVVLSTRSFHLVCKPTQGGPDGRTYEPGNQAIFFAGESVPFIKGQVEIQYYEEGKGPE